MNSIAPAGGRFTVLSRLLHWSMAVMVIGQFFLGVTMIAALSYYPLLLAIHRPLGIAILVFAIARLLNRLRHRPPPFLATMGPLERRFATYSERLLYALLLIQPLLGWVMLSAAQYPMVLVAGVHLPAIAPHNLTLYAVLRTCHGAAAYLLFATFTAHICAVVFHTVALRDGLITRMTLSPSRRESR